MKRFISPGCWGFIGSLLLLCVFAFPVDAQSVADMSITATSGLPGTEIHIVNANPSMSFQCFAGNTDLGYVSANSSMPYIIPPDAVPNSVIEFRCYVTNVDTTDTIGSFVVLAPVPTPVPIIDSDGDGIMDNQDECPLEFAQTPNGCPSAPTEPAPAQIVPTATFDTSGLQPVSPIGACTASPAGGLSINVREAPSTTAAVIIQLQPGTTHTVLFRTTTADGEWYQTESGWISASVIQLSGDCSNVPIIRYEFIEQSVPAATPTPVRIVQESPARYDLENLLALCPKLIEQARQLTFQAFLDLIRVSDGVQRCADARWLIQRATFSNQMRNPISDDQAFSVWSSTVCWTPPPGGSPFFTQSIGSAAANYNTFIRTLLRVAPDVADAHFRDPGNGTFNLTWRFPGFDIGCDVLRLNRSRIGDYDVLYDNVSYSGMMTIAVLTCPQAWTMPTERLRTTIIQMVRIGFNTANLLHDPDSCLLINEVHLLGTLSSAHLRPVSG